MSKQTQKEKIISLENEDCLLFSQWGFGMASILTFNLYGNFWHTILLFDCKDLNLAYLRFFCTFCASATDMLPLKMMIMVYNITTS